MARDITKLEDVKTSIISKGGDAHFYSVDLSNADKVKELAQNVIQDHGLPDVIVNSAGAGRWLSLDETSMEEFKGMIESPLLATSYVCKAFLAPFKKRNSGHFITINSVGCYMSWPGSTAYLSARWGLRGFMDALYEDLFRSNVKSSMIAAGKVDSPYFSTNTGSADRIPKIGLMLTKTLSVDDVALCISKTIKSPKKEVIIPRMMSILVFLNKFFPTFFSYLLRKTSYKD